jgi:zinc metalloprotease ZmpA
MLAGMLVASRAFAQIPGQDLPALAQAQAYFQANASKYGLDDLREQLRARRSTRDSKGSVHIRFDQYFNEVRVFEGEAIAHVDPTGQVTVTDAIRKTIQASSQPRLGRRVAALLALFSVSRPLETQFNKAELVILPAGRVAQDTLAWHFQILSQNPTVQAAQWDVFVDAISGNVAWKFASLETTNVTGTGYSMYSGPVPLILDATRTVYDLLDVTRGSSQTRDLQSRRRGDGEIVSSPQTSLGDGSPNNTDPDTAGVDGQYAMEKTWDYFQTMFGRNGIDGTGRAAVSYVHYGRTYENAYWNDGCFCMTYGDGGDTFYPLVTLDIGGHEIAHGILSAEANLTYDGESGGLNEANSDIFGTMVEFYANNPVSPPNYWIGERALRKNYTGGVYTRRFALRYMDDPEKDGRSPACWDKGLRSVDVHYSSGPANHLFYLLSSDGPITGKCNSLQVPGIGREKAARIWYHAMVNFMTSSTDYAGARVACLLAAAAIYGNGSTEYNAVAAAFSAINVN